MSIIYKELRDYCNKRIRTMCPCREGCEYKGICKKGGEKFDNVICELNDDELDELLFPFVDTEELENKINNSNNHQTMSLKTFMKLFGVLSQTYVIKTLQLDRDEIYSYIQIKGEQYNSLEEYSYFRSINELEVHSIYAENDKIIIVLDDLI